MDTQLQFNEKEDPATIKVAYIIYILYFSSVLLPILPFLAVIFAYIFENDAKSILKSHYQFLIRSFWIGILYFTIACLFLFILIGVLFIPLCIIWWFIRIAKGLKSLLRNEPIANPKTWMF